MSAKCEKCERDGQLVVQDACPGRSYGPKGLQYPPFVFRYYLCRHHRAAWNRHRMEFQKKMIVLEPLTDSEVLKSLQHPTP